MTGPERLAVPTAAAPLPSGAGIPLLGYGTWRLSGRAAEQATGWALAAGYRHIDTATMYRNEAEIGAALAASGVPRTEVFLTTKLPADAAGQERATLEASLTALRVDRVDLWLVHWPPPDGVVAVWERFAALQQEGLAVDIGVSNFSLAQLDEVTATTGIRPAVNQIRWSPLLFDQAVLAGHRQRGVLLEGYSGLLGGVLTDPAVVEIADRLGRTPAQVVIRWHLQHGVVVIPKSADLERLRANADVDGFTLSDADLALLDDLARR